MKQQSNKYLMFGWRVRSLLLIFAVVNNGELHLGHDRPQAKDSRLNPAYLNPDLYREGIASLVNAKERAEELLFKNDIIARLVTELPYHEIQNRLLISGNHKEVNRSFFERLPERKRQWNCGKGFDIYKLLNVVQKSRERAENLTQYYGLSTTATPKTKPTISTTTVATMTMSGSTATSTATISEGGGRTSEVDGTTCDGDVTTTKCSVVEPTTFSPDSSPCLLTEQANLPFEQMQVVPSTVTYREKFHMKIPLNKSPARSEMVAPISSAVLSQGSDDHLLTQPRVYKPPMLIPILDKSYVPYPLKYLPNAIDTESSRVGISESNVNSVMENGYRHFKNFFLKPKSRS